MSKLLDSIANKAPSRKQLLGGIILLKRNGKVRAGLIKSYGPKNVGVKVLGMSTGTLLPRDTELVPMTVYVTKEVADNLTGLHKELMELVV